MRWPVVTEIGAGNLHPRIHGIQDSEELICVEGEASSLALFSIALEHDFPNERLGLILLLASSCHKKS